MRNTLIVNMGGGPGIGKSRSAARLFAELKDRNQLVEIVVERAKDLAWMFGGNPGAYTIQPMLHAEQLIRQAYSMGKVDFIITDSPSFLPALYTDSFGYNTPDFRKYCIAEYHRQNNLTINLIREPGTFVAEGRHLDEEGAVEIDNKINKLMMVEQIECISWSRDKMCQLADDLAAGVYS